MILGSGIGHQARPCNDEARRAELSTEDNGEVADYLDNLGVGHLVRVGQDEVALCGWDRDCDLMMSLTKPLSLLTKCSGSFATTLVGRIGRLISHSAVSSFCMRLDSTGGAALESTTPAESVRRCHVSDTCWERLALRGAALSGEAERASPPSTRTPRLLSGELGV